MSNDPVAVVRATYEAFGRGEIPAALGMMAPDVEWVESEAEGIPTRGTHMGPQQVAENVFSIVPRDWQEFDLAPEDFFVDGDTVIVRGRLRAVAKATGKSLWRANEFAKTLQPSDFPAVLTVPPGFPTTATAWPPASA